MSEKGIKPSSMVSKTKENKSKKAHEARPFGVKLADFFVSADGFEKFKSKIKDGDKIGKKSTHRHSANGRTKKESLSSNGKTN